MHKRKLRKIQMFSATNPDIFNDLLDTPYDDRQRNFKRVQAQVRRNLGLPPEEQKPTPEQVREYLAKRKANA